MKKTITFYTLFVAGIICSLFAHAQSINQTSPNIPSGEFYCGQDEMEQHVRSVDPGYDQRMQEFRKYLDDHRDDNSSQKTQAILIFPVVFHVLYNSPSGNVSDACIQSQIDALNRDFRKLNSDISTAPSQFQAIASDFQMEFCLATKDPNGNPTSGIERKATTSSGYTVGADDQCLASKGGLDSWGNKYLNFWVLPIAGNVGGYGTYPFGPSVIDGVYVRASSFGQASSGCPCIPGYDKGRSAVHEVGHWFGLLHTFNGGCVGTNASNCASEGDRVCDTPPVGVNTQTGSMGNSNCTQQNSCTETPIDQIDMIQNYMDYTRDFCKVLFTQGQRTYINSKLWMRESASNNAATVCVAGTGLNELEIDNYVSVFPNPSSGNVFVELNASGLGQVDIKIYNIVGKIISQVHENAVVPKKIKLNFENYPDGVYFIEIKTIHAQTTKKFVIAK